MSKYNAFILLFACLSLGAFPAIQHEKRVYDAANELNSRSEEALEQAILKVEERTTAQVAVVIVKSLDGLSIEDYAFELFNQWGIGQKNFNNGVLFLVAPIEKRVRIEVGFGLEPLLTDSESGEILDQSVLPYFKQGKYAEGIVSGTKKILELLESNPIKARGKNDSTPTYVLSKPSSYALMRDSFRDNLKFFFIFIALIFALILFGNYRRSHSPLLLIPVGAGTLYFAYQASFFIFSNDAPQTLRNSALVFPLLFIPTIWKFLFSYRRYGPHACPACRNKQILLSESQDDSKLPAARQLEEKLGSVDYDVWYCPACLHADAYAYINSFSELSACPACERQTLKSTSERLVRPTYFSSGKVRITNKCVACEHTFTELRSIPRRQRPNRHTSSSSRGSSSRSSSFGGSSSSSSSNSGSGRSSSGGFKGGSSGGGGSSRSW